MSIPSELLLALVAAFAVTNGVNDGGALVANELNVPQLRPITAIALLTLALGVAPWLVGTAVARTLAQDLVAYEGQAASAVLVVAVLSAVAVVVTLSRAGLPTSLTLALVGAITGAGFGLARPVSWSTLAFVLLMGLAAPVAGALLAFIIVRSAGMLVRPTSAGGFLRRAHLAGYGAQCLAYGANDGQKMYAVLALATTAFGSPTVSLTLPYVLLVTASFALGAVLGLPAAARTFTREVLPPRPPQAVSAEFASAAAVLASSALGAPVSMTQSTAGGLIGAGMSESFYRVRWRVAGRLALAWVVTLPASFLLAALGGGAVSRWF